MTNNICHLAFALLEKYYPQLLACFPEDYMISLEKISRRIPNALPSHIVEHLTAPAAAVAVNKGILIYLFSYVLVYDVSVMREIFFQLVAVLKDIAGPDRLELSRQFQKGDQCMTCAAYM